MANKFLTITGSLVFQAATHIFGAPSANQNPFGGQSLQYTGGTDPNNKNYSKLSQKLNEADIERRKIQEEAERRERAAEIRREERLAKIQYMRDMPDTQPAGTGECIVRVSVFANELVLSFVQLAIIYHADYSSPQLMSSCLRRVFKTNLTS